MLKEDDKDIRFESWNAKETDVINDLHLLTAKPALYLVNMSEKVGHPNPNPKVTLTLRKDPSPKLNMSEKARSGSG